jgi:succinate dehydrogenase / fumarate reductase cytochrome b subunit
VDTLLQSRKRPVYLDLRRIRLPVTGLVSILHRITGVALFLASGWFLYLLDRSLASEDEFHAIRSVLASPAIKSASLILFWAFCHHLLAGVRFLLLDLQQGLDINTARATSWLVIAASLTCTTYVGIRLW